MDLIEVVAKDWRKSRSDDDWREVTNLAWRPAWRIRSRRGTFALLRALFRQRCKSSPSETENGRSDDAR